MDNRKHSTRDQLVPLQITFLHKNKKKKSRAATRQKVLIEFGFQLPLRSSSNTSHAPFFLISNFVNDTCQVTTTRIAENSVRSREGSEMQLGKGDGRESMVSGETQRNGIVKVSIVVIKLLNYPSFFCWC